MGVNWYRQDKISLMGHPSYIPMNDVTYIREIINGNINENSVLGTQLSDIESEMNGVIEGMVTFQETEVAVAA